jgi:predicted ABC-type ATPase
MVVLSMAQWRARSRRLGVRLQKATHPRVSKAIAKFVREGIPHEQAVAKALSMERAGRLDDDGNYVHVDEPMEKGRPGLQLVASKKNPRVKRWQRGAGAETDDATPAHHEQAAAIHQRLGSLQRQDDTLAKYGHGRDHPQRRDIAQRRERLGKQFSALPQAAQETAGAATSDAALGKAPAMPEPGRPWVDALPHLPSDTLTHYSPNGQLTPERRKLWDQITAHFLDQVEQPQPGEKPELVMMMGGTASGKSSATKHLDTSQLVHLDADAVKGMIPEYQEAVQGNARNAAALAHEESSAIMKEIRAKALAQGKSMLMDGTGAAKEKYLSFMRQAKARGYHVTVLMTDVDKDTALARARERAEKTGRYVPEHFIHDAYAKVPHNFIPIAHEADDFALYNTRTSPAAKVWSRYDGHEQVHDPNFVQQFKQEYGGGGDAMDAMKKGKGATQRHLGANRIDQLFVDALEKGTDELDKLPKRFSATDGVKQIEDDAAVEP